MNKTRRKSKYQNHKFTNIDDIKTDLENSKTIDSQIMHSTLSPIIEKLQNNGIHELQDISLIFKNSGFNNKSMDRLFLFLQENLPFQKINSRTIYKLNNSYRNIIFNSVFLDFPDNIIQLVDYFVTNFCPEIHNHDYLIHKLKNLINSNSNNMEKTIVNVKEIFGTNQNQFSNNDDPSYKKKNNEKDEKLYYTQMLNYKSDEDDYFVMNFDQQIDI